LRSPLLRTTTVGGVFLYPGFLKNGISACQPVPFWNCPFAFRPSLPTGLVLFFLCNHQSPEGAKLMEWTTPKHEEIDLNCEVSSYANAEL
jgi:hypothetical protein